MKSICLKPKRKEAGSALKNISLTKFSNKISLDHSSNSIRTEKEKTKNLKSSTKSEQKRNGNVTDLKRKAKQKEVSKTRRMTQPLSFSYISGKLPHSKQRMMKSKNILKSNRCSNPRKFRHQNIAFGSTFTVNRAEKRNSEIDGPSY